MVTKGYLWWKKIASTMCSAHMLSYDKNCKVCNDTLHWVKYTKNYKQDYKESKARMKEYERKNKNVLKGLLSEDDQW